MRSCRLKDQLKDERLEEAREAMVDSLSGKELTVQYLQKSGFAKPVCVSITVQCTAQCSVQYSAV